MNTSYTNISKRRHSRRGNAVMEGAIVMPLLITIMLLAVDYGRYCHSFIAVTNAARSGAYYGSFHPVGNKAVWDAAIRQAVADELETNSWFDANVLVVAEPLDTDDGSGLRRVTVDVSYPFQTLIAWPLLPGSGTSFNLRRVVAMRGIR